jgi:hypothetical protein
VRLSGAGVATLVAAVSVLAGGLWSGSEVYRGATAARRHVALFATERHQAEGLVVRIRRHGEDRRRTTVHYQYDVGGREFTGVTTMRRPDRDRYQVGSTVPIWYLATEPGSSWLGTYAPEPEPMWPAFLIPAACLGTSWFLATMVRRQVNLLTYGRSATAVVKSVEKKRSENGTFWRVNFEWTLLSGATRKGRYSHTKKQPPEIGTEIPVVYDRDEPSKYGKYPLKLVALIEMIPDTHLLGRRPQDKRGW